MTTCRNYKQHTMKLSNSRKKRKHINTCEVNQWNINKERGAAASPPPRPFGGYVGLVDFCRCLGVYVFSDFDNFIICCI